ncbi:PRC-barrel domain-containing protein [Halosegnis longus]|uniref:Photosystem reaction center subunit H n=1 Tax=Halosegnis longus TaxID=2216012 RepID=A0AAJ4RAB0_9EURY|nr:MULTISPECIES: PRC-barrel domain-containing protein [Halobacteriales]RNJ27160.1 photosystem reaction center subunit H [Salella cibi]
MTEILAENLSDKRVVGSDGSEIGTLYNVTMNFKNGSLQHLLIDPLEGVGTGHNVNDRGRIEIPVSSVQAVKDHIVVAR